MTKKKAAATKLVSVKNVSQRHVHGSASEIAGPGETLKIPKRAADKLIQLGIVELVQKKEPEPDPDPEVSGDG